MLTLIFVKPVTGEDIMAEASMNENDRAYIAEVNRLCASKNELGLNEIADSLAESVAPDQGTSATTPLLAVCKAVRSSDLFNNSKQARDVVGRLAALAVMKADSSQVRVKLEIMNAYLRVDSNDLLPGQEWSQVRRTSARLWLDVWSKLEDELDSAWNPADPANEVRPYVPTSGVVFISGMSPEGIKDPVVRAEYEAHLQKSHEIAARNKWQRELRAVRAQYAGVLEDYIIRLYVVPPQNTDELNECLVQIASQEMKDRIRAGVSR
jgi:hypothetical protein